MRPLPNEPYEPAVWTGELLVGNDYLVSDGLNKYSVPFDLIGEKVVLRLTKQAVEVFYRGSRAAIHLRTQNVQREPIVKPEHMPQEHRKYLTYTSEAFSEWAVSVGENTSSVVRYFLSIGKEPEQGFKFCASMTKLAERYGTQRLEKACGRLLAFTSSPSIRTLTSILKNGQDKVSMPEEARKEKGTAHHGITRGAAYFRKGARLNDDPIHD